MSNTKKKWFDPKKSFFDLKIVRVVIVIHLMLAGISAELIFSNGSYGFEPSADGFNKFLNDFKFSIGVLAMLIPAVALLATNHRSEQTKEQIWVAEQQNVFSNFYKHYEEFEKYYLDDYSGRYVTRKRKLHSKVFSSAYEGKYEGNEDFLDNMRIDMSVIVDYYDVYRADFKSSSLKILADKSSEVNSIYMKFFGFYIERSASSPNSSLETEDYRNQYYEIHDLLVVFQSVLSAYEFNQRFTRSKEDQYIIEKLSEVEETILNTEGMYLTRQKEAAALEGGVV